MIKLDKGGRTVAASTVQKQLARTLNPHARQLGEAVLAKALQGDVESQRTAAILMQIANPVK